MADHLLSDLHDGVLTLTLNRPDRLNALSAEMLQGLSDALRSAERDASIRALILTGAGRGFSSGADITDFQTDSADGPLDLGARLRQSLNPLVSRMRSLEKPILAAINGAAAGAGLSLALACDLRFAAASARLVVAFIRIGLVPDAGALYFLPRLLGHAKALELAWTGDPVDAQHAYELGLVNQVLPDAELLPQTQQLAARLAHNPITATALIKRALNQTPALPLDRVLELEATYQTIASRDPDFQEGIQAFRQKRPPHFAPGR